MDTSIRTENNKCAFAICKKKLKLTDFSCRCKQRFCAEHRFFDNHNCSYDYKNTDNLANIVQNMKCIKQKVDVI